MLPHYIFITRIYMAITHLLTRSNPNRHEVIKVVQSEMLQVLQELYVQYDGKEGYCGLELHPDADGQPIWCSLESWNNRENEPGWTRLADGRRAKVKMDISGE